VNPTARIAGICGCLLAALGLMCGAFGAHALRASLDVQAMALWQTAVQYQFLHALGLLLVAAIFARRSDRAMRIAGVAFVAGSVLFCGSLYALALGAPRGLGMLTPVGGFALLIGWVALACAFARVGRQGKA
jgi:uncharacterized membrane protein YgdD (TMEM256/DUF423 family)